MDDQPRRAPPWQIPAYLVWLGIHIFLFNPWQWQWNDQVHGLDKFAHGSFWFFTGLLIIFLKINYSAGGAYKFARVRSLIVDVMVYAIAGAAAFELFEYFGWDNYLQPTYFPYLSLAQNGDLKDTMFDILWSVIGAELALHAWYLSRVVYRKLWPEQARLEQRESVAMYLIERSEELRELRRAHWHEVRGIVKSYFKTRSAFRKKQEEIVFYPSIFTWANLLTSLRIMCVLGLLSPLIQANPWVTLSLFLTAVASDKLDGILARKFGQITKLGVILDPFADKLLYFIPLFFTAKYLGWWLVVVSLVPEVLLVAVRFRRPAPANWWGKIKAGCQFSAMGSLLLGHALLGSGIAIGGSLMFLGWIGAILALPFSFMSLGTQLVSFLTERSKKAPD